MNIVQSFTQSGCLALSWLLVLLPSGGSLSGNLLAADATSGQQSLWIDMPRDAGEIVLQGPDARWQVLVTLRSAGEETDVTQQVQYRIDPPIAMIDSDGYLQPVGNGRGTLEASMDQLRFQIPIQVQAFDASPAIHFSNQVVPIFTKFGCNGGGCHGKAAGQGGFRLSLLGFESEDDYEHLVSESRGRRVFPSLPDQSLLLLKAINASPHGGGQRFEPDSQEYRLLRRWIATGMPRGDSAAPVVTEIEITPRQRRLTRNQTQQLNVIAVYSDGSTEDITRMVQFESNNTDLATVDARGKVTLADRAGDVAVMARYQGQVAVFAASIPLGIEVAQWPDAVNLVDEKVFDKLRSLGIPPSDLCDDATFLRRVTLDIAGRLPTPLEADAFLQNEDQDKRSAAIDRLLDSEDYAAYFAKKWTMILRNRRANAGYQLGTFAFSQWLRQAFADNQPYDQIVRQLLTATGTVETDPAVSWWRAVPDTESRLEDTAQLFLGQRLQCAKCHHHPQEKWGQADYYHMAAFFSKVVRKEGPVADEPMFVSRVGGAAAKHPKTGANLTPAGLDAEPADFDELADPREHLVDWMVQTDNPFFAKSLVNRYWKHFFGVGLVEPEDDMRVTNPPSNQELLDGLADFFATSGFDLKTLVRLICNARVYQLSSQPNEHNLDDTNSYSRFYPKRLTAEVLLDAVDQVLLSQTVFEGLPAGTRAVELPDTGFRSYFLDVFGRPAGSTACQCERSDESTLAQSLQLLNSKELQGKLSHPNSRPALMSKQPTAAETSIDELYLAALCRYPTPDERTQAAQYIATRNDHLQEAFEDLVWALINSKAFLFNH